MTPLSDDGFCKHGSHWSVPCDECRSEDYDERRGPECDCGADKINTAVDALLAATAWIDDTDGRGEVA